MPEQLDAPVNNVYKKIVESCEPVEIRPVVKRLRRGNQLFNLARKLVDVTYDLNPEIFVPNDEDHIYSPLGNVACKELRIGTTSILEATHWSRVVLATDKRYADKYTSLNISVGHSEVSAWRSFFPTEASNFEAGGGFRLWPLDYWHDFEQVVGEVATLTKMIKSGNLELMSSPASDATLASD